ncbi:hypothetical protein [Streptomyces sp. 62]|uniref:hypothetical protein n=1 Tax=Streptomyces sp. NPDC012756 TaxID=3364847 RepID=UPI000E3AAC9C
MKVYDVVNGDELVSDAFPIKEDGICYVVEGKYVTRTVGAIDIGAVDSSEETDDTTGSEGATALNAVDAHRLTEMAYDKRRTTPVTSRRT